MAARGGNNRLQWAGVPGMPSPDMYAQGLAAKGTLSEALHRVEFLNQKMVHQQKEKPSGWSASRVCARVAFGAALAVTLAVAALVFSDVSSLAGLMTSEDDELAGDAPLLSMGEGFDASMGEGYADLGETATAPSNATMGDADADGTAATDERSLSRWGMGERADTLFDGADTTGTLRHTDPFSPMPVAVAVAANADTPDDPDQLTTGEDHTAPQEDVDAIAKGVDALNAHPIKPAGRPELLWRDRASLLGQTMRTHGPAMKTLFFGADELEQWMGTVHGEACVTQEGTCTQMRSNWDAEYPAKDGVFVNAIGGDAMENIVWRIYQEGVAGLNPYVCVLYVGNNELSKGKEAVEVAAGIQAILKALHFFLPNTEFLIVGLLPRADDVYFSAYPEAARQPPPSLHSEKERKSRGFAKQMKASVAWQAIADARAPEVVSISFSESKYFSTIRQVNDWLQVVANEAPSVHFLDCSLQFLVPGPTSEIEISSMLMKDFYHLTVKGQAKFLSCIRDTVQHLQIAAKARGGFAAPAVAITELGAGQAVKGGGRSRSNHKAAAQSKGHSKKGHGRKLV